MHFDAVFWGAVISVGIAIVILIFLGWKVKQLMSQDAEKHRNDQG